MNPQRLLQHFDRIAEAPDAIARLRRFILDLAVRGKLVEQDPNDKPASKPLGGTQAQKFSNGAFPLPASWTWIDVRSVAQTRLGKMLDKSKNKGTPRPYLRNINVRWFGFDLSDLLYMPFEDAELAEFELRDGDVLICEGGEPGRAAVWDKGNQEIYFQKAIHRVRFEPVVVPRYFVKALKASADEGRLTESFTGTGIKHLTGRSLSAYRFPLPPLAEQHRIVAKIDELMALCDRLETAQNKREQRRDRLVAASLNRINQPAPSAERTAAVFREHARFHLDHLQRLTTRPEHIKSLRQTILNLAFRGRFSSSEVWPQTANRLADFAFLQNGYAFKSEWFTKSGTRLLRNANVGHGLLEWTEEVRLPTERVPEFERFQLRQGDVVLSLDRPFIITGTKVGRVREKDLPALLLQRVGRFCLNDEICPEYLFMWINSPAFSGQIDPGRSNGVPHISSKQVESATLFVPPVPEQHRIVAKIDELMAVCDQLEAQLTATQTDSRRLLEAVLHEAVA